MMNPNLLSFWLSRLAIVFCLLVCLGGCEQQRSVAPPSVGTTEANKKAIRRLPKERPIKSDLIPSSTPELRVKVHRLEAGEADEEGWCSATSTEGGFTVRVPSFFNDATMYGRDKDGVELRICVLGMATESGVKYAVTANIRADEKIDGDKTAGIAQSFGLDLKSSKKIVHNGLEGIEFQVSNRQTAALMRAFQASNRLYLLVVEYEKGPSLPPQVEADVRTFFGSFQIESGKPPMP